MRPKAAATPAATIPEPKSRPMAAMVAAAAFEVLVNAAVPEAVLDEPPEVGVAVVALLEVAVKLVGSMVPQLLSRF